MKRTVYCNGNRISLGPQNAIGQGGEAEIYSIGSGKALKLFKPPSHVDFSQDPAAQLAAEQRIREHQQKLRDFPRNLPASTITPIDLVTSDANGKGIVGYTMPFLSKATELYHYGDRQFREGGGIDNQAVTNLLLKLHTATELLHRQQVIVGDFNDLNVLIDADNPYLIDADSFQFGNYLTMTFQDRFVDPLHCDPKANRPNLVKPHSANTDWYAFSVMVVHSLLYTDPYGGIHRPKDVKNKVPHTARPLHRLSIFHPEVAYPKPAKPIAVLCDDLLHYLYSVFMKDARGTFPLKLLKELRWSTCPQCGVEHAHRRCPNCHQAASGRVAQTIQIRGTVTANRFFQTTGTILFATVDGGKLRYLYHEKGVYFREDGRKVAQSNLIPHARYALQGERTLVGTGSLLRSITPDENFSVDVTAQRSQFAANEHALYWLSAGQLLKSGQIGPEYIGDILPGQTRFWVGRKFGIGFYRAGNLTVSFIFDAKHGGLKDSVALPRLPGQLVDATCRFADDFAWLFAKTQSGLGLENHCILIKRDGTVLAHETGTNGDDTWLGSTGALAGSCPLGSSLFVPTDDGMVRLELDATQLVVTKQFPDTKPFVTSASQLLPAPGGMYVVGTSDIKLITIQ